MRLKYLQVTAETWGKARMLGGALGVTYPEAFVIIMDLWAWALELGDPNKPPDGIVPGPGRVPGGMLAGAVGWRGDPEHLLSVLETLGLIERGEQLRVRGMDRYRSTWAKMHRDRERAALGRESQRHTRDGRDDGRGDIATPFDQEDTAGDASSRDGRGDIAATSSRPSKSARQSRDGRETVQGTSDGQDVDVDVYKEEAYVGGDQDEAVPVPGPPTHFSGQDLVAVWNETAKPPLAQVRKLDPKGKRAAAAKARARENPDPEFWREVIERLNRSDFARGMTDRGTWTASFDFLVQPDTATKVLEGKYDNRKSTKETASGSVHF